LSLIFPQWTWNQHLSIHLSSPDQSGSIVCVEIAVFSPLPGAYTYIWPQALAVPEPGLRVLVPFGSGKRLGVVLRQIQHIGETASGKGLRAVEDRLDASPLYDQTRVRWLERIGRYYLVSIGEVWSTALSWAAHDDSRRFRCVDIEALVQSMPVLREVFHSKAALSLKTIMHRANGPHIWHVVTKACAQGLLQEIIQPALLAVEEKQQNSVRLSATQKYAVDALIHIGSRFQPFLLFGCTGSGKTEVYLRAAEAMIADGGQVLVLVPEIGLTPMWVSRLVQRFEKVAVWHSGFSKRERLAVRQNLAQTDILIGTRSALFLPLSRLSMIVVDEEHDSSFKQQEGMAYSARDMAVLLAQELKIPVVLGSATPSLESWSLAEKGSYQRLNLPQRVTEQTSAIRPEIVDMRSVETPVSETLLSALKETLAGGEQSILFLNRRGYAPALQCSACGFVPECPDCSMRLTLHRRAGRLRCHICEFWRRVPKTCESCGEAAFLPLGEGTEKLEDWLTEQLPALRFARFDRDIMTSHSRLTRALTAFERGELDCLIGTQMLVKGHDFPHVTLVGVINADLGVNRPDFRAGERWWQQMTQVTGRAGRGEKPGRVVIQTRMPEAAWLERISEDQAESTLHEELQLREALHYPPYSRWVRVVFSAMKAERASQAARAFADHCVILDGVKISGVMPCSMERVAGRFRFEVLLRDPTRKALPWKLEPVLNRLKIPSGVRRRVDVDPQDLM
jgi:primosomal protein N' (replication factor Y)